MLSPSERAKYHNRKAKCVRDVGQCLLSEIKLQLSRNASSIGIDGRLFGYLNRGPVSKEEGTVYLALYGVLAQAVHCSLTSHCFLWWTVV